ncbi:MAG: choice-of-anchor D domain-containing protein, partial [bacterium]
GIEPDIALSESSHDYGQVPLGSSSEWILVIFNEGTAPLAVIDVSSDHSDFSVLSPSFPKVIGAGDSLEVTVAFHSENEGTVSATLTVLSADPDEESLTVALSAQGVKAPDIALSALEHDFGQVLVASSSDWTVTISNVGTDQLTIDRVDFTVTDFLVISHAFPQTVPVGEQLEVTILFSPSKEGPISGTMTVVSDDPDEENVAVSLSGEGVVPEIDFSATSYDFGEVVVGTTSEWVLTISNIGTGPLTVRSVSSDHPDFSVTSPIFPQTVASGADIAVTITFAPTGDGPVSAELTISSNDPDEATVTVIVRGTALLADIEVSALSHDFGDVVVDSLAAWTFGLANVGTAPLTVEGVESDHADITVVSPPFPQTVEVGDSLDIVVHFVPTTQGSVAAQLTIRSNDPHEGTILIDLMGNGIPPVTLHIERTEGEPGARGLLIPVEMDNVVPVAQIQFSLHYDSTILTVTDVERTARGANMGTFNWSQIDLGQIVVLISDFTGQVISPGVGSIADLRIAVADSAPPQTVHLSLMGVAFFDSLGNPYEARALDGLFTVVVEDIDLPTTEYDFGEVGVGVSVGWQLIMLNIGTKELAIDNLISDNHDFSVTSPDFPQTIAPSGSLEATVTFTPSVLGDIVGRLTIVTSDPDEGSVIVSLNGDGVAAAILEVSTGSGEIGSSDNLVELYLENRKDVYGLEWILNFDAERLSVTDVQPTDRSEHSHFNWTTPAQGQVRVVISALGGIPIRSGDGPVAELYFAVAQNAPGGAVPLSLSGVHAFDYEGEPIVTEGIDGLFLITGADILLKEMSHGFDNVGVGDSALWQMYVFNIGTSSLRIDSVSSDNPTFVVAGPEFPQAIPPDESLAVTVIFVPLDTGTVAGSLAVFSSDRDEGKLTVLLTGTGAFPDISVPVVDYAYGTVGVGNSQEWLLTVFNLGPVNLYISNISTDRPEFQVVWPRGFPQIVVAGGSMGTIISFVPSDTGLVRGTLEILSNDPDEPSLIVTLSGEGGILVPDIAISSAGHDFGSVVVGGSGDWVFTISNEGVVDLTVQSVLSDAGEFSVVSPTFPQGIQPGATITVEVLFTPSSVGPVAGVLTVTSDDPDEAAVSLSLSGEGVLTPTPEIVLSAYGHNFGSVTMGESSDWWLEILNEGTADLTVHSVRSDHAEFVVVAPDFPRALSPGGGITVTVRFAPVSVGIKEGALIIASSDPDEETVTVQLSGEGVAPTTFPQIGLSASEYNFGTVKVGQQSNWGFEISNLGQAELEVFSALSDHSDFWVVTPDFPVTVDPGGRMTVEVVFAPSSEGLKAGALTISCNDPQNPEVSVLLSGTGEREVSVQLLSFSAAYLRGLMMLTWTTSSEIGQAGFRLSRKSDSDGQFRLLTVDGLITGSSPYRYLDNSIEHPGLYQYQLVAVDDRGEESIVGYTSAKVDDLKPSGISLAQNYPNPFNPETRIEYLLTEGGWVDLSIYNLLGQRVKIIVTQFQKPGYYMVTWGGDDSEGRPLNSGVYIAQLKI